MKTIEEIKEKIAQLEEDYEVSAFGEGIRIKSDIDTLKWVLDDRL